jgi:hypothetical protein
MKKHYLGCFAVIACLFCAKQNDESVIKGIVSSCGGFNASMNKTTMVASASIGDTVVKEYISWKYNDSNQTVEILHTGCSFNCAAELTFEAIKRSDSIFIIETDHRYDPGRTGITEAGCSCAYDLLVEVPDITGAEYTIVFTGKTYHISLRDLSGSFELKP